MRETSNESEMTTTRLKFHLQNKSKREGGKDQPAHSSDHYRNELVLGIFCLFAQYALPYSS